jgi:uncharacterized tellurite resistance protein B-like protein
MHHEGPSVEDVRRELALVRKEAEQHTFRDLMSGEWFVQLVRHALETYAKSVDAEYFETKYPGLNRDAIVDRRIDLAQRYAALAGGLSASAYSAAVIATLGSKGGASPITLPAAVASFAADLYFLSRLQLQAAYDLSVLYGHPIDMNDPEDLIALIKVAFGVKAGEELQNAAAKLAPEAVRQGVRHVVRGPILHFLKALPVVGKYLLQRNIIKMAIPGVSIPLSAGLNYYLTGHIARVARQVFRDKAVIEEAAPNLIGELGDDSLLLLQVIWLVAGADGKTSEQEAWLINALAKEIQTRDEGSEVIANFRSMVDANEAGILAQLANASAEVRTRTYEAACIAAAIDHRFHRKEKQLLQRIAEASGIRYEPEKVTKLIEQYAV